MFEQKTMQFAKDVDDLKFSFDGIIYNPLDYAWKSHETFLKKYIKSTAEVLFLGMNPGPFGMVQNGIPFGEVIHVKEYLNINVLIDTPKIEHPGRPILGLKNTRSEISGKRFWSLMQMHYPNPNDLAAKIAVFNYCPLAFLDSGKRAKNITPDKLKKEERNKLFELCDNYISGIIEELSPKWLIGVGQFAKNKLEKIANKEDYIIDSILHPSPGNPQANKNWNEKVTQKLIEIGVWEK